MTDICVLLVEDSVDDGELIQLELQRGGFNPACERVETCEEMSAALHAQSWDIILSDYTLPQFSGLAGLRLAKESDPDRPFIIVSGTIGEEVAVQAIRLGADDYILKKSMTRLTPAVQRAMREASERRGRRKTEQTVNQLAAIIRCADDAIWGRSLDGIVTSWNPGAERLFGYSSEEIIGTSVSRLIPGEHLDEIGGLIERMTQGERIESFETVRLRKDGSRVEVSVTVSPILDPSGLLIGASTIARDISEKRRAEETNQRQSHLLQSVLASIGDGVVGMDEQGRFVLFNQSATAILGVGQVDAHPNHWPEHYGLFLPDALTPFPPDRLPLVRASLGETVTDEEMFVRNESVPEGRWISINATPLVIANGDKLGGVCVFRDITERKKAEQEFARRALILSNVRDSVIVTELDGIVTYWNDGATRLFGWTAEEMLGRPLIDRYPEGIRSSLLSRTLSLETMEELVGEFEDFRKDGSRVWIDARVTRITDDAGEPLGILGLAHDITERKQAEARVRLLDRAMQAGESGILISDPSQPDNPVLYASPGFERMTGYRQEDVLGKNCRFLQGKGTDPATVAEIRSAIRDVRTCDVELLNYRKDGSPFWNQLLISPVRDEQGLLTHFVGTQTDVTERRSLEEQLRNAFDHAPVGMYLCSLDGHWLRANPALCKLVGRSEDELKAMTWRDIQHPDYFELDRDNASRLMTGEITVCNMEKRYFHKDGHVIWVLVSGSLVRDPGGDPLYFVGHVQDISERRQLEEQFRQAQKMEAVGRLAGGVAHDFNNLLTVITGYGDMLLTELRPDDPTREFVREITNAGERAAGLTRQLLAFSRKTVLEPKVLDINVQVREMDKLLKRLIGEDVDLGTRLDPDLGRIEVDAGQLEQAIINLCVNSRDAMPQGGQITIETHNAELDNHYAHDHADVQVGSYVLLAVTDSGHGMDAATKARIFEPFFTTKEQGKGTGLGLAMVYGFVKQSGGHIAVYSEPGLGTTFKIYLPRVPGIATPRKLHPGPVKLPKGNEMILLVEDEDGVRALARHVLQTCGYTVIEASHGKEAMRIAEQRSGPIHLLITDVVMPQGMGGRQVAEALRVKHPEARVLFVSGYTDDAVVRHGVLEEKANFLQKPFTPASLAHKVRDVLDQSLHS